MDTESTNCNIDDAIAFFDTVLDDFIHNETTTHQSEQKNLMSIDDAKYLENSTTNNDCAISTLNEFHDDAESTISLIDDVLHDYDDSTSVTSDESQFACVGQVHEVNDYLNLATTHSDIPPKSVSEHVESIPVKTFSELPKDVDKNVSKPCCKAVRHKHKSALACSKTGSKNSKKYGSRHVSCSVDNIVIKSGYLNKTRIVDASKKKVKKNWTKVFVILKSTNLMFLKDHKTAPSPLSQMSPSDDYISLVDANVISNPKKVTSRKNTILVSLKSGCQYLFHTEEENVMMEWYVQMTQTANCSRNLPCNEGDRVQMDRVMKRADSCNADGIRSKLLAFLIRRPTKDDLMKRGIIRDVTFGAALQSICDRENSCVPRIALVLLAAIEKRGLNTDGIYRVSGNLTEIQKLRYAADRGGDFDVVVAQSNVHALTGTLKMFFRELQQPLFTSKLINTFFSVVSGSSHTEKLNRMKRALKLLPKCNYDSLNVLLEHLKMVEKSSASNRMRSHALSIVFGPTLLWSELDCQNFSRMAILSNLQVNVINFILEEFMHLF